MRRRQVARARRRRRAALALVGAVGSSLLVAGVGPGRLTRSFRNLTGPSPRGSVAPAPAPAQSLLLAIRSGDDRGGDLVLFGVPPKGEATALMVPSRTQVEVPSLGPDTLGHALRFGGGSLAGLSLENALGVRVQTVVDADATALRSWFADVAPLGVELRAPVSGRGISVPAGRQRLDADQLVALVTQRNEPSDLDHLVTVASVLQAWLAAVRDHDPVATGRRVANSVPGSRAQRDAAAQMFAGLTHAPPRFDTLRVQSVGLGEDERYKVDTPAAVSELRDEFPNLLLRGGAPRVRVEILNGTGQAGLARDVAAVVVPAGAQVVLTGNAGSFGVGKTVLVVHQPSRRADAARLAALLGVGELRAARQPLDLVDVSIVVGSDFRRPAVSGERG